MAGQEKVFFILERHIDGWLELTTPTDEESGEHLNIPISPKFFNALIELLEEAGYSKEGIAEIKTAYDEIERVTKEDEEADKD